MKSFPQPGAITLLVVILITCTLLFLFQKVIWLVVPFLLALMLFYCLRPAVEALVVRGMRHETAAKTVWILLQSIMATIVLAVGLLFVAKAGTWQTDFNRYVAGGENLLKGTAGMLENNIPVFKSMDLSGQVDQVIQQFTNRFAGRNLLPVSLQSLKWLPSLLLVPYFIYFMLNDSARLKKYIIKSVPNAFFEKGLLLCSRLDATLQNYFQGLFLLTLLDTACLAIGLEALGVANAIWLGLASAILAWIPTLGSLIGCVLVVLVAATDFPDRAWIAYACLLLFLSVRMLDDFLFMPLTIGRKLRVHPLLSVLMLCLGAAVAGTTGLVLALPLFGVVAVIGETVSQVVTDRKLKARYRATRQLVPLQTAV
ncbi:MAG TPA: AI-2E family transporter [Candidatus Acidoferrales bacterium]|nr:AI-2E family transporter [Candidatus Acidoferrales bacterium]